MVRYLTYLSVIMAGLIGLVHPVWAQASKPNKYASIIINADSLEILHARQIDKKRFPASLTKMMTLYLTFDALESGDLSLSEAMPISANAARTPPVKLGLKAGQTITVQQAISALTVRSANDAAVVLAERIGGSQSEFAYAMSMKAKDLGMQSSLFKNPHGLPNTDQITTARDMAKLAHSLLRTHGQYYHYFSQDTFEYNGRTYKNHNRLLGTTKGVDGFKTGFTNASGYNLVISAKRGEHRIIAVVLGGASGKSRNQHMDDLIERGFNVITQNETRQHQSFALNADELAQAPIKAVTKTVLPVPQKIQSYTLRAAYEGENSTVRIVQGAGNMLVTAAGQQEWAVQIGAYANAVHAKNIALSTQSDNSLGLVNTAPQIIPVQKASGIIYRARLVGLSHKSAAQACKILAARGQSCLVVAPS